MNHQKDLDRQTASSSLLNIGSQPLNKPSPLQPPSSDMNTQGKEHVPLSAPSWLGNNSKDELTRVLSDNEWSDPAILQLLDDARELTPEMRIIEEYFYPTKFSIRGFLRTKCPSLGYLYLTWTATGSIPAVAKTLRLCMRAGFRRAFWRTSYFLTVTIPRKCHLISQEPI